MKRSRAHILNPRDMLLIAALTLSLSACIADGSRSPPIAVKVTPTTTAGSGTKVARLQETAPPSAALCPVTRPPDPPLAPPMVVGSPQPPAGQFWYGNDALWLILPADGVLSNRKVMWWRTLPGTLTIAGRRLDSPAPPLEADLHGDYGTEGFQASGINFPVPGCWEVVGSVANRDLRFVVMVYPRIYWESGEGCQYLKDTVSESEAIIVGKVEGTIPDRPGFAWQTVRVQRVWKGSVATDERLDLLQSTGETQLQYDHAYILFLRASAGYPWRITCPARSLGEVNGEQVANLAQNRAIEPLWSATTLQAFDTLMRRELSAPTATASP